MKKTTWMLGAALSLGMMLTSCSQDSDLGNPSESGKGQLLLTLDSKAEFIVDTRAVQESSYGNVDNYTVIVTDKDGAEKLNCKGSEVVSKMPLTLAIGSYEVKAFYGTESAASRDAFYVYGETKGTIKADQRESVSVTCTPTCGRISVNFDASMATYFADYNVSFSGTEALAGSTIAWLKGDTEPWYVKLTEAGENVNFVITVTTKDEYINGGNKEQVTTKSGSFKLSRNKAYKMNISPVYTPTGSGDLSIEVTIDDTTEDKEVDIEVPVTWV